MVWTLICMGKGTIWIHYVWIQDTAVWNQSHCVFCNNMMSYFCKVGCGEPQDSERWMDGWMEESSIKLIYNSSTFQASERWSSVTIGIPYSILFSRMPYYSRSQAFCLFVCLDGCCLIHYFPSMATVNSSEARTVTQVSKCNLDLPWCSRIYTTAPRWSTPVIFPSNSLLTSPWSYLNGSQ